MRHRAGFAFEDCGGYAFPVGDEGLAGEEAGGVGVGAQALVDQVKVGEGAFREVEVLADVVGVGGCRLIGRVFGGDAVDVSGWDFGWHDEAFVG